MLNARIAGYKRVDMTVTVRSSTTGRELKLAGTLHGGEFAGPKTPFGTDKNNPLLPVENEVSFHTKEAEGFDYFVG